MTDYRERAEAALQRLGELRDLEGDTDEVATNYVADLLETVAAERDAEVDRLKRELFDEQELSTTLDEKYDRLRERLADIEDALRGIHAYMRSSVRPMDDDLTLDITAQKIIDVAARLPTLGEQP